MMPNASYLCFLVTACLTSHFNTLHYSFSKYLLGVNCVPSTSLCSGNITKLSALIELHFSSQRKNLWLVRENSCHLKSAAIDTSGHLIVPSGDKQGEQRGQIRKKKKRKESNPTGIQKWVRFHKN